VREWEEDVDWKCGEEVYEVKIDVKARISLRHVPCRGFTCDFRELGSLDCATTILMR
jgi:hypothetical protein